MRERSGVAHDRVVMPMRFGFADTLSGQLHFRACGAGPDIVLLPWLPASGRMFEHVMPHLARAGFRAIAFDLAGSGRSHKKCRNWTVQQYAADVLEACGSLHTVPYTVVGGRFSASVAVEMLLASPAQVTGAVLDGVPGLAPEELRKMTGPTTGLSPKLADDGAHRSFAFDVSVRTLKDWDPAFELTAETLPLVYEFMRDYLELGFETIAAGVDADAKGGKSTPRRARAPRRSLATRAGHDLGCGQPRARLQPRARTRTQFARPQVRRQPPRAHAGSRRRIRAGSRVVRAALVRCGGAGHQKS